MKNFYIKLKVFLSIVLVALSYQIEAAALQSDNPRETPIVKIVRENKDAVVNISTERIVLLRENPFWGSYGSEFDIFFERYYGYNRPTYALKLKSIGSGVIVDKSGIVVTNAHVVNMASNVFVVLNDGTSIKGQVMYEDPKIDLAIVKIDPPKPLIQISLGASRDIMIGETIVAIGDPLGFENSVTAGIISGKDRTIYSSRGEAVFEGLIQIDAPINPGNSGGALLNLNSELIGINVAVVENSQSIGFAIPVEKVKDIMDSYKSNKTMPIKHRRKTALPQAPQAAVPQANALQNDLDPFEEMERLQKEMQGLLSRGAQKGLGIYNSDILYDPNFNIEDNKDSYAIKLDISGMDKDKLNIEINEDSITVSGQRSEVIDKKDSHTAYRSQRFGSFLRSFPIPEDANTKAMESKIEKDTLVITIPKK